MPYSSTSHLVQLSAASPTIVGSMRHRCELQLAELLLRLDIDSLQACEDGADSYEARRLLTMSQQVLFKLLLHV
ncbi:hypothetical protein PR003_g26305 [Phytophthora rubi]|uniref:Uncharacterized protein n=1 Tax=Phytophthora rubi TaxID=129364 RepID=A0A6A4CD50_9STRA|nr:hypothetical protein PR003_g26305 [Phytophthora rubi]